MAKDLYRIGITGSYGGLNLGDEAILHSIIAQLRRELANKEQVPAYIIFGDATLRDLKLKVLYDVSQLFSQALDLDRALHQVLAVLSETLATALLRSGRHLLIARDQRERLLDSDTTE